MILYLGHVSHLLFASVSRAASYVSGIHQATADLKLVLTITAPLYLHLVKKKEMKVELIGTHY